MNNESQEQEIVNSLEIAKDAQKRIDNWIAGVAFGLLVLLLLAWFLTGMLPLRNWIKVATETDSLDFIRGVISNIIPTLLIFVIYHFLLRKDDESKRKIEKLERKQEIRKIIGAFEESTSGIKSSMDSIKKLEEKLTNIENSIKTFVTETSRRSPKAVNELIETTKSSLIDMKREVHDLSLTVSILSDRVHSGAMGTLQDLARLQLSERNSPYSTELSSQFNAKNLSTNNNRYKSTLNEYLVESSKSMKNDLPIIESDSTIISEGGLENITGTTTGNTTQSIGKGNSNGCRKDAIINHLRTKPRRREEYDVLVKLFDQACIDRLISESVLTRKPCDLVQMSN